MLFQTRRRAHDLSPQMRHPDEEAEKAFFRSPFIAEWDASQCKDSSRGRRLCLVCPFYLSVRSTPLVY